MSILKKSLIYLCKQRKKLMKLTKKKFKTDFFEAVKKVYSTDSLNQISNYEQLKILGFLIKMYSRNSNYNIKKKQKKVYYFSIEFLPGRTIKSNLLNLGILDIVRQSIMELGLDFNAILSSEPDPGLGNGGLGRLASCYMDSMTNQKINSTGMGIRYSQGMFKQKFVNGYQVELPDNWLKSGDIWSIRRDGNSCVIRFGGEVTLSRNSQGNLKAVYINTEKVLAVPYDIKILGYENNYSNILRLWSAESLYDSGEYHREKFEQDKISDITRVLYPDDSYLEGQVLRIKQEYFLSSAGIQNIVKEYLLNHKNLDYLNENVSIQINDTHPTLVIPELMRILMDDYNYSWDKAWNITVNTIGYTNHTILQEALEIWSIDMVKSIIPRIYQIILEINSRFYKRIQNSYNSKIANDTCVIFDNKIKMANLAVIGSHSVNGVAPLHSELLKSDVLKDLYRIYPKKFSNKTNGFEIRRWLLLANEPLSGLIDKKIGMSWHKDANDLIKLMDFYDDESFLNELNLVKNVNKKKLADYIQKRLNIKVDKNALFDVQIKRMHAYKRQLLNVLNIIREYLFIKKNPNTKITPKVHIFSAKAAPSYLYAKYIIKIINELANKINNDESLKNKLKVVFIPNYSVSIAEMIIPAADVSEQISTASKEASGTSNMKMMANGALTLATMDGANIDIISSVGKKNSYPFGLNSEEIYRYYANNTYNSYSIYHDNEEIRKVLDTLIDGTIPNIEFEGREIYNSLLKYNDEFFVLADYEDYVRKQNQINNDFTRQIDWQKKVVVNIANSGKFSSDISIKRYSKDIWNI